MASSTKPEDFPAVSLDVDAVQKFAEIEVEWGECTEQACTRRGLTTEELRPGWGAGEAGVDPGYNSRDISFPPPLFSPPPPISPGFLLFLSFFELFVSFFLLCFSLSCSSAISPPPLPFLPTRFPSFP